MCTRLARPCDGTGPRFTSVVLIVLAAVVGMAAPGGVDGQGFHARVESRSDGLNITTHIEVTFSPGDLELTDVGGYDAVYLKGAAYLGEAGKPRLPARTVWVAVPAGMTVAGLRVVAVETEDLPGHYTVIPAGRPKPITSAVAYDEALKPDPTVYGSSDPYPPRWVTLLRQADLAGQNMAAVLVCPLRFVPAQGSLTLAKRIEIAIEGRQGRQCGDYLPRNIRAASRARYEDVLKAMVINPGDVEVMAGFTPRTAGVDPGQYDYVIITTENLTDDFEPLADWRTKQGRPAAIVSTEWIYTSGGYAGTDVEKIRAFVADAHATWGATDFLLGGDSNLIPYHVRTITIPEYWTDDIDNDTYYADYDDDWILEVNIGRAPVRAAAGVGKFRNKVITYEKSPPLTGYAKTAFLMGFDTEACGVPDGETFQEDYIRTPYIPGTWSVATEYDSEPGTHKDDALGYLDQGYHLVNHFDHCNINDMGAAWNCHAQTIGNADMDTLTNGGRLSIIFPVGCFPARFTAYKCIGEAAMMNVGGGCIAFIGNTCYGWGGPMGDMAWYSAGQNAYFYRNLFDLGMTSLGDNFSLAKNDEYDPYDPYNLHMYCFTQLHLLGDPALTIWTDDPLDLTVAHPYSVLPGEPATFAVEVSSEGSPVDGATVCLWKESDVYEVGQTLGGIATFNFTPAAEGTLYVTVCMQNHIPYEGEAAVSATAGIISPRADAPLELRLVSIAPNPFAGMTEIAYAIPTCSGASAVTVSIYDCLGRHVRTVVEGMRMPGLYRATWNGADDSGRMAASGIYYCDLKCDGRHVSRRIALLK